MEICHSRFLSESMEALKKYVEILSKDYEYVSLLATDVIGKRFAVTTSNTSIVDSDWGERGVVIRVYHKKSYSEFAFNELNEKSLDENIDHIRKMIDFKNSLVNSGIESIDYKIIEEEEIKEAFNGSVKILPESMDSSEKVSRLSKIVDKAHEMSKNLVKIVTLYEDVKTTKVFLSAKKELVQTYIWSQGYIDAIVKDPENPEITKEAFNSFSGLKGPELIDEMESDFEKTIKNAEMLLKAQRIEPGEYEVICAPSVSGLIAHEAFGHGVEMDMFVKNRAKAKEFIDKYVASEITSMHDGASAAKEVSSYWFDDEGVMANDIKVIDKGILKAGISDQLTALQLGSKSTGNGKRQSFDRKVYTRMTNTFFSKGNDKLEDMIASIDYGYLLEDYYSGMEDPKNWGIQCIIAYGKEIKNGKFTGKVVSPIMMTGYVPDLLKSISMVSNDMELSGSGGCGKGYKEFVKVSCGGPYIKAKARLG